MEAEDYRWQMPVPEASRPFAALYSYVLTRFCMFYAAIGKIMITRLRKLYK
jgi:hypothetical protein